MNESRSCRMSTTARVSRHDNSCTKSCLNIVQEHAERYGCPTSLKGRFDQNGWFRVTARWNAKDQIDIRRERRYTYKGFSWGYGGEGPHGLMEMIYRFLVRVNPNARELYYTNEGRMPSPRLMTFIMSMRPVDGGDLKEWTLTFRHYRSVDGYITSSFLRIRFFDGRQVQEFGVTV